MEYANPKRLQFCDYYKCRIEHSDREFFEQVQGTLSVSGTPIRIVGPSISKPSQTMMAIYITPEMLDNLINNTIRELREKEIRESDSECYARYMEYKLWLELKH